MQRLRSRRWWAWRSCSPPALERHTATVLPWTTRHEIGSALVADLQAQGAQLCTASQGRAALDALQRQVLEQPARVHVLQDTPAARVTGLPGGVFVIDARLLDMADSPEALAGALVLAQARLRMGDPVAPVLGHIGVLRTLGLLTSGTVPTEALSGYAGPFMRADAPLPDVAQLLSRFQALDLSARAFADNPEALDPDVGPLLPDLRKGDPLAGAAPSRALLSDGQWVSLQNICVF